MQMLPLNLLGKIFLRLRSKGIKQTVIASLTTSSLLIAVPQLTLAQSFPTGGTITEYTDGGSTYRVHTFGSNGTFSIPADTPIASFDYLVVGGGGSGAFALGDGGLSKTNCRGLGGGAGGQVLTGSSNSLTGNIGVVVGAGGASVTTNVLGNNGNPSSFGAIQATGGGGAGLPSDASLYTGGGGTYGGSTVGFPIPSAPAGDGSGHDGGATAGDGSPQIAAGGGAGAGGDGGNAPSLSQGGNGGIGVESTITGTSVYYGGGGGGGACGAGTVGGSGGLGGGGDAGSVGTNGLGGGGGGGGGGANVNRGGRGVVIVAYKLPPTVTDVTSSTANGHYLTGASIDVRVTLSEPVTVNTVNGTPTLTLETGATDRTATYVSGSGSSTLVFSYSVQAGDTAADLDYVSTAALSLNGGTIKSSADSSDAVLTLPSPGATGSLGANKAIVIDTTAPVVTDAGISLSTGSGTNGEFIVGDTVTASWQTSGSDGDTSITASLGSVTVDFSAFGGDSNVTANLSGTTWTASYTIVANTSASGSNLNVSVTATDEAGNFATGADTSNATVDANPPFVSAANITLSGATGTGGAFKIGDTVTATWDSTANGDNNGDIASVSVDFSEFGGGSAVTASNSSGTWTATYTITSGSIDLTNRNVSVTATDTAGNDTTTQDDENATVDNVPPTVTAANISVRGATGDPNNSVFKIGDTVIVEWNDTVTGDNNADTIDGVTVDFSDFGGSANVAATNSAGVWTAIYEYTAGTIAGSNYGVSITVTDNAGNTTTTDDDEQLSLDNVQTSAPAEIALEDDDNSGGTTDTITNVTKPTISGTAEANATIDVYVDGTLVGQTTTDGTGAWSYTFATDLAEGDNSITTTATDAVGNTSDPSAPLSITIDTTPPAQPPAPALDPAGNTGIVSDLITSDTTPPVSGTAEPNSTVEIFVDGDSVGTVTADSNGDWSFALPEGSLTEGDNAITLTSTDVAGNTSAASDALTITLDTTAPSIAITDPLMGDNLFNAAETPAVTLSGTTTDVDNGQTVTLSVSDGTTSLPFTTTVTGNAWTTTVDLSSLSDGQLTITADVTDVAGNAATQASHTIAKDIVFPSVQVTGPTEIVTAAFDVTISFSKPAFGFELTDVTVAEGTATNITGTGDTYIVTIDPVLGKTVQVSVLASVAADAAGNPNLRSNLYEVEAGSPASEFAKYLPEIRQIIVDEAERSLRSGLSANQRMVRGARGRFVAAQREQAECSEDDTGSSNEETCDVGLVSRNNVAFDVDGTFALNGTTLSTSGEFFQQTGNYEGTQRRLFFGDFDVQHDSDTGSSTATLTARVAWEQMTSDRTMLGYFIGGELAHSSIDGAFEGDQDRIGVTIGGYAVHQLAEQVYLDGFVTLGAGRNNLEMANDVLALTSDYTTRTATMGAALSGVYDYERYEFRPELAFSYGKTWIGNVGFTGRAYGLVDDTLSLDAGNVSIANLTFRPEVIWALDADTVADSNSQFSFAPRLICERTIAITRTENCGGGAEIGLSSTSDDGLSNAQFRVIMDRVGDSTRSSLAFNLERRF